ncbi:unnamed protein product [Clonostachys byssicola]|uniref:Ubiquitin-like domain-containing protein n=1 Tax=Clonostachys byssicola TaxID=160290 RepID=A0A9N9XYW1_9HYPO|nr:unnamed protein product [Clonostachys byssicola]
MAEVSFASTFLTTLDARPIKLPADYVEDARKYPGRQPYILPRMPKPMSKPTNLAPGQERSVKVTLKSARNPPLDIKLTSQPLDTSILDLKAQVHAQTRAPVEKLKILHNKKPVPDSKVLKELLGDADTSVEFTLMVMGGAAAIPPLEEEGSGRPLVVAPTGADALETSLFWSDLKGFLSQRLKDDAEAEKLSTLFKSSWESSKAGP